MYRKRVRSARQKHMSPVTVFLVLVFIAAAFAAGYFANLYLALALLAADILIASSLKMYNVWQEFMMFRLGKLLRVGGRASYESSPSSTP